MRRRRSVLLGWGLAGLLLLVGTQPARAFLPSGVEQQVRSWFDGAGKPGSPDALRLQARRVASPCTASGTWGQLTIVQTTPGGAYCFCDGKQQLSCLATPAPTATPTPTATRTPTPTPTHTP